MLVATRAAIAALVSLLLAACTGADEPTAPASEDRLVAAASPATAPVVAPSPAVDAADVEPTCQRTRTVSNSAQLRGAADAARPGDCIVLEDGSYELDTLRARGTADHPIGIRARNRGRAVVSSGGLRIEGAAYLTVEGLDWTSSGAVVIADCDHCRIARTVFRRAGGAGDWITVTGTSTHTRIDHNDFGPWRGAGHLIVLGGTGAQVVQHTRIDHNHVHDVAVGAAPIRVGLARHAASSGHAVIEHNVFERCDGDAVAIESSDNTVRGNTVRARGIAVRRGKRNEVAGNGVPAQARAGGGRRSARTPTSRDVGPEAP
jgi:hypothetical protein